MDRRLDDLDRRVVADLDRRINGEGDLRETECSWIRVLGRADELDAVEHRIRHVGWDGAEPEIDVDVGGGVALEPAGLEGDGAAFDGPFRAVGRGREAAAWKRERSMGVGIGVEARAEGLTSGCTGGRGL